MLNVTSLLEAVSGDRGYRGGSYVDELPHLGLTEAAGQLPCVIVECQMEFFHARGTQNGAMVEAAVSAIASGTELDLNPICESALEDLKTKSKAFFDRMLKFVRSIIAKLKVQIDKHTMNGKELWNKYEGQLQSAGAYRDLTFEGYRFGTGARFMNGLANQSRYTGSAAGLESLIKDSMTKAGINNVVTPEVFAAALGAFVAKSNIEPADRDAVSTEIDNLKDVSKDERMHAIITTLCGKDFGPGEWSTYFRKQAWGDRTTLKYGDDMFTIEQIKAALTTDKYLTEVKKEYEDLESALVRFQSNLEQQVNGLDGVFGRAKGGESALADAKALASQYYSAYITIVSDALDAVSRMKNTKVQFYTDMNRQATAMFSRLVSHAGTPAAASEDATTDVELLDFEL